MRNLLKENYKIIVQEKLFISNILQGNFIQNEFYLENSNTGLNFVE